MATADLSLESQLLLKYEHMFADTGILWIHAPKDALITTWDTPHQYHFTWQVDHHEHAAQQLPSDKCELALYPRNNNDIKHIVVFAVKSKEWFHHLIPHLVHNHPNATLWIIGAKKQGTASLAKSAQTEVPALTFKKIASGRHCLLFKQSQPINLTTMATPQSNTTHSYSLETPKGPADILALPGVFSRNHLDEGTALLLDSLPNDFGSGEILDFGCGSGVISAWIAKTSPQARITGVDVDLRAIHSSRLTLEANGLQGSIMPLSSLKTLQGQFDWILSNPPFHDGFKQTTSTTHQFFEHASQLLRTDQSQLRIVANSFLPYKDILDRYFKSVTKLQSTNRFTIWSAHRASKPLHL